MRNLKFIYVFSKEDIRQSGFYVKRTLRLDVNKYIFTLLINLHFKSLIKLMNLMKLIQLMGMNINYFFS